MCACPNVSVCVQVHIFCCCSFIFETMSYEAQAGLRTPCGAKNDFVCQMLMPRNDGPVPQHPVFKRDRFLEQRVG